MNIKKELQAGESLINPSSSRQNNNAQKKYENTTDISYFWTLAGFHLFSPDPLL